ncbi:FtsB family cell division protein [Bifidobacterium castoris]|uniref:FtsB family cell division protein n=1 Tax=Bifidobacterium castoris TaxID=2306972 RepID=UPI000F7EA7BB|nr:septum formation initiator family protein [Bifidobacterium castoris]
MSTRPRATQAKQRPVKRTSAGPIAFFVALFIVALGLIQLISTFHSYALDLSELNGLRKQEAALVAQKQELENDIERWDDDAYVTAQARERLGYVFPGEQPIRVEHPEAVTGEKTTTPLDGTEGTQESTLPWYSEMAYSFREADAGKDRTRDADARGDENGAGAATQPDDQDKEQQ